MRQFTLAIALIVGVGLALMPADYSFAQAETLQLGTTDLRLDMKKTEVLNKLRSPNLYELKESTTMAGCPDAWEAKSRLGPPYQNPVGDLCFKDDKLVAVVRNWAECKGEDVFKVARALFSILNASEKEGKNQARFRTESKYSPETTSYMIYITAVPMLLE